MSAAKHTPGPWEPIKLNSAPLGLWAVNAPGYGGRNPLVCGMEYSKGGPILHAESEANARLIADCAQWARASMQRGAPLVHRLPGRAGWELRLVVQGGLRILDKVDALQGHSLHRRPRLRAWDWCVMLGRALVM